VQRSRAGKRGSAGRGSVWSEGEEGVGFGCKAFGLWAGCRRRRLGVGRGSQRGQRPEAVGGERAHAAADGGFACTTNMQLTCNVCLGLL
jgi:hypothetical protein